jgi:hypothetical protein
MIQYPYRPLLAGSTFTDGFHIAVIEDRPTLAEKSRRLTISNFRLFRDFKSVVDLDTKIPNGKPQLGVAQ